MSHLYERSKWTRGTKRRPSGCCPKCGTWRYSLHRDHVIPVFKGGTDTPDNWQYLCANCHEDKTREDLTGRKRPIEAVLKTAAANRGQKRSLETRAKISAAGKGRRRKICFVREEPTDIPAI